MKAERKMQSYRQTKQTLTFVGPGERMGEGDTEIVLNLTPPDLAKDAFSKMISEVQWQTMIHRGGSSSMFERGMLY